jgi:hypothetical protein
MKVKMKNIKTIVIITFFALYGCGGGGGGGESSTGTQPENSEVDSSSATPETIESDFTEGDTIYTSSSLEPLESYDFKTYNELSSLSFDNSTEMSSGCSILVYSKYRGTDDSSYEMLEKDLILEAYEPTCSLSGVNLSYSNKIKELMVVYSDSSNVSYEIISI